MNGCNTKTIKIRLRKLLTVKIKHITESVFQKYQLFWEFQLWRFIPKEKKIS